MRSKLILLTLILTSTRALFSAESAPFFGLYPEVRVLFPSENAKRTGAQLTPYISRAGEQHDHAYKKIVEMFGFLVIKNDSSYAIRAITPIRIGNASIGFTLEEFSYNRPFINAQEFSIYFPTQDAQKKILDLIAKAAKKEIPSLDDAEKELLAANSYAVIHAKKVQRMILSTPETPMPGDETKRVFVVAHVASWQEQARNTPFLSYGGGRVIPWAEIK